MTPGSRIEQGRLRARQTKRVLALGGVATSGATMILARVSHAGASPCSGGGTTRQTATVDQQRSTS